MPIALDVLPTTRRKRKKKKTPRTKYSVKLNWL